MTLMDERTAVVDVIAKAADDDEGAALTLLQFGFYEALCDEADRIRPQAEYRAAQEILKRTEGAFERLAKRYADGDAATQAEASEIADELLELRRAAEMIVSKDYLEQHNVTQGEGGKFRRRGGVRGAVLDLLGIGTRANNGADSQPSRTASTLNSLVGSDADTYSRLRTIGQGLTASSNSNVKGAGTAARIVGDVGHEAQRALEPGIRRTAYRYRGTERRPSAQMQRTSRALGAYARGDDLNEMGPKSQGVLIEAQQEINAADSKATQQTAAPRGRRVGGVPTLSDAAGAMLLNEHHRMSPDQKQLAVVGDFGALSLRKQIPDVETARISLEAGKMPPSVGLMFDADGNLVSEAMGFNGDHYLPFDLKNLKRLKGGQYVRTRTTGGPTDEDVYTALLSGARQIQVISNSGNFVLEFDPDLRGGRRYSDKARQMVERYGKLVAAIGSGKLMQTDLKPEEMRQIRRDAFEQSGGDEVMAQDLINEQVRTKRMEARFGEVDEDALLKQADTQARKEYQDSRGSMSHTGFLQRRNDLFEESKKAARTDVARSYRLDGEGYNAAMKALKTEFPYFIRDARYTPLHEFLTASRTATPGEPFSNTGGGDLGYTKPGELMPYRTQGGDKRPKADRTGVKPARGARTPSEAPTTPAGAPSSGAGAPSSGAEAPTSAPDAARRPSLGSSIHLPEPDAPSLEQLAAKNQAEVRIGLQSSLGTVMGMAKDVDGAIELPPDMGDDPSMITSAAVNGPMYLGWLKEEFSNDTRKMADFLAKPENAAHRAKLREAIEHLQVLAPRIDDEHVRAQYTPEKLQQAASQLDLVDGAGALFEEGEPSLLTVPNSSNPKPQAWPAIMALGASKKNFAAYARANPEIAKIAAELQAAPDPDRHALEMLEGPTNQARLMAKWTAPDEKPAGVKGTFADARQLKHQGEKHPIMVNLQNTQLAWALVKAEEATRALTESEPLSFADAGPKAKAPEQGEAAKRFAPRPAVRVVMAERDSPIAKAFAARASRSRRQASAPASR